ncbi:NUDIX domain-containing protein [Nocardia sp. GCM10030253]|uniref:NUDIX hydrolase n=1 Tax=Nocardia sp. GCM10030253 TaxID=3273404 RepID=UPI0036317130
MPYTIVVDVLLLIRDDRVLLAQRCNTGYADGQWNLPSGKLEEGEDLELAMIREAEEEIGIRLRRSDLRMATSLQYRAPEGHSRVGFVFYAERWEGEPFNAEPHKCSALEWVHVDELPADTVPYTRAGIELYRRGAHFGIHGWPAELQHSGG